MFTTSNNSEKLTQEQIEEQLKKISESFDKGKVKEPKSLMIIPSLDNISVVELTKIEVDYLLKTLVLLRKSKRFTNEDLGKPYYRVDD